MLEPQRFERKTFVIEAVQVSLDNMPQVVAWCGGTLQQDEIHRPFIKIDVRRPANLKQTMAYIGDWVTKSGTAFRIYTDSAFHRSFERTEKPVDPYQSPHTPPHGNVFDLPGVDRKLVKEELTEKPVGDERLIQGESVEVSPQQFPDKELKRTPFSRTPQEIREAHRTGASGLSPASVEKRAQARGPEGEREYYESFRQQHGRYPGQPPLEKDVEGHREFAGSLEQAYEGHPGLTNDLGETLEQWAARTGHGPTENPDPEH